MQREQDDTGNFIKRAISAYRSGDDFGEGVRNTITSLMMSAVVPWIDECFSKYDEYTFHVRMQQGFSFIQDFRENHSGGRGPDGKKRDKKYLRFMHVAKAMHRNFGITLDEEQVLKNAVQLLRSRGWMLYDEEVVQMRDDLFAIKAEIEGYPLE